MKEKILTGIVIVFVALFVPVLFVSLYYNCKYYYGSRRQADTTVTASVSYVNTTSINPTPVNEQVVGRVAIPSVYFRNNHKEADTESVKPDSSVVGYPEDSIFVPRVQREYGDSSYTAWVSGYDPKLDSIRIRERIVTNNITVTRKDDRRWSVGIVGGYGYGFQSRRVEPFVGVGVTWRLFPP